MIPPTDFDSPWMEAMELYFDAFMKFFFPRVHAEIDWLLVLPRGLKKQFRRELAELGNEKHMAYVTSCERLAKEEGYEKGALQDAHEMVLEALDARFSSVPEDIASALQAIETREILKSRTNVDFHVGSATSHTI